MPVKCLAYGFVRFLYSHLLAVGRQWNIWRRRGNARHPVRIFGDVCAVIFIVSLHAVFLVFLLKPAANQKDSDKAVGDFFSAGKLESGVHAKTLKWQLWLLRRAGRGDMRRAWIKHQPVFTV